MALFIAIVWSFYFILGRVRCAKIYEQIVVVRRKLYRCDLRVGKQYRVFVKCDYGYYSKEMILINVKRNRAPLSVNHQCLLW